MKIGMILEDYYPEDIRITKEILALVNNGYKVYLLCMKRDKEDKVELINNITVVRANLPIKQSFKGVLYRAINAFTFNHPLWYKEIYKFVKHYNIDIIHIHDLPLFGSANRVSKLLNKKIIIDFHENYPDGLQVWGIWKKDFLNRYIYPILGNYKRWLKFEKIACENADRIIVVVNEMKQHLKNKHNININKTFVVSNTELLNFEKFNIDKNILKQFEGKFIVSYIGGVGFHRGIDIAIKAFNKITNKDIYLLIVGEINKDVKAHLDKITKTKNIIYTGQVPFEKVASYIKISSVCLVPHRDTPHTNNTIPHKLFQYMILKKTVIVSSCPPLKRVIEDCNAGVVFKADDEYQLYSKIIYLYNNKDRLLQYGLNGYNCVLKKYNFEYDAKELLKVYEGLKK